MAVEAQGTMAKIFNVVCLFLQVSGLAIAIAGVAILQSSCNSNYDKYNFAGNPFGLGPNSVKLLIAGAGPGNGGWDWLDRTYYHCGMQYSWYWWVLALQLVCIIAGLLANFTTLRKGKPCIIAFFAVATALWCIFAYAMCWEVYLYQAWDNDSFSDNKWAQGYACGAAGAIITLVGNFIFLMIFGYDGSTSYDSNLNKEQPAGFQAA